MLPWGMRLSMWIYWICNQQNFFKTPLLFDEFIFICFSKYSSEVRNSQYMSELLGAGIAAFQGLSNLAINGVILVVLYGGAVLIDRGEMKAGDLMSYLVATQMVQK